jgi:hypothetical protein
MKNNIKNRLALFMSDSGLPLVCMIAAKASHRKAYQRLGFWRYYEQADEVNGAQQGLHLTRLFGAQIQVRTRISVPGVVRVGGTHPPCK